MTIHRNCRIYYLRFFCSLFLMLARAPIIGSGRLFDSGEHNQLKVFMITSAQSSSFLLSTKYRLQRCLAPAGDDISYQVVYEPSLRKVSRPWSARTEIRGFAFELFIQKQIREKIRNSSYEALGESRYFDAHRRQLLAMAMATLSSKNTS